jgi:hypothetical protein
MGGCLANADVNVDATFCSMFDTSLTSLDKKNKNCLQAAEKFKLLLRPRQKGSAAFNGLLSRHLECQR